MAKWPRLGGGSDLAWLQAYSNDVGLNEAAAWQGSSIERFSWWKTIGKWWFNGNLMGFLWDIIAPIIISALYIILYIIGDIYIYIYIIMKWWNFIMLSGVCIYHSTYCI